MPDILAKPEGYEDVFLDATVKFSFFMKRHILQLSLGYDGFYPLTHDACYSRAPNNSGDPNNSVGWTNHQK